jgi:hypothetical protein
MEVHAVSAAWNPHVTWSLIVAAGRWPYCVRACFSLFPLAGYGCRRRSSTTTHLLLKHVARIEERYF